MAFDTAGRAPCVIHARGVSVTLLSDRPTIIVRRANGLPSIGRPRQSDHYDAACSDIRLHGMNGWWKINSDFPRPAPPPDEFRRYIDHECLFVSYLSNHVQKYIAYNGAICLQFMFFWTRGRNRLRLRVAILQKRSVNHTFQPTT